MPFGFPTLPANGAVDHTLRRSLIAALKSRHWMHLDAAWAAEGIGGCYGSGQGEWLVRLSKIPGELDLYLVTRSMNGAPVFDSHLEGRARDVAAALNELEEHNSFATARHEQPSLTVGSPSRATA
jgi:hypothetical protein